MRLFSGLCILMILVMVAGITAAPTSPDNERFSRPADKIISPSAPTPEAPYIRIFNPPPPRRDDIIGEAFQAGDTYYDYQSNGSIGKFIAKDPLGVIHVTWMDGYDDQVATRHQKYNFYSEEEEEWREEDGIEIANDDRSGYGCLWMSEEGDDSRPIAFFHGQGGDFGDEFGWAAAIDFERLFGAFMVAPFPTYPDVSVGWPQGVATAEGAIHVFGNDLGDNAEGRLAYLPAQITEDFGEIETEVDFPFEVGETHVNTYRIARSLVSERVALTWISYRDPLPIPEHWDGLAVSQMNNDLMLAFTDENGENWNFEEPFNVTRTIRPNVELEGSDMYGDTLLPYNTHDIIFDSNDNIHIVFDTRPMKINPQDDEDGVRPPVDYVAFDRSYLFHWSEETDEFSVVADGYFSQEVLDENGDQIGWPSVGAWKSNVCYPSLAFDEEGDLYCVFNYYPYEDYNDIGNGISHGDIAMTVSEDNGETWYEPTMVVETESHQARSGEAFCEVYPTIAERIDDNLHIFYEVDKEAGTPIQDDGASYTQNPFFYQRIPKDQIERDEIVEGPSFHISFRPQVTDSERDPEVPIAGNPVVATANVTPPGGQELESVTLQYRVDEGDEIEVAMENVEGDVWAGTIPAQEDGAWVWYRIRAEDTAGLDAYSPSSTWWFSYTAREDGGLKIQDIQIISLDWAVDYSGYRGYEVTVQGIVTTPFTFNEQYGAYVIQDADGGEWSGVMLRGIEEDLTEGDRITVTGTVMERDSDDGTGRWSFATYIDVSSYEVIDQVDKPEPMAVDLGDIVWEERGEHLESVFVQVFDFEIQELDSADQAEGFWRIRNNTGSSWLTTNGLTEEDIEEKGLTTDDLARLTQFAWMKGIVAEGHGHYAVTPTQIEEVGPWAVESENTISPTDFTLHPAYPNPFNATTTIGFDHSRAGLINLSVYDLTGRVVADLLQQNMSAGSHEFILEATALSAGIYILKLETDSRSASQKIVLMK